MSWEFLPATRTQSGRLECMISAAFDGTEIVVTVGSGNVASYDYELDSDVEVNDVEDQGDGNRGRTKGLLDALSAHREDALHGCELTLLIHAHGPGDIGFRTFTVPIRPTPTRAENIRVLERRLTRLKERAEHESGLEGEIAQCECELTAQILGTPTMRAVVELDLSHATE